MPDLSYWYTSKGPQGTDAFYYNDNGDITLYVNDARNHNLHLSSDREMLQPGNIRPVQTSKEMVMALPRFYRKFKRALDGHFVAYNPFANPNSGLTEVSYNNEMGVKSTVMDSLILSSVKSDAKVEILQIKGWGSGIQPSDYETFFSSLGYPHQKLNLDPKDPSFQQVVRNVIGPYMGALNGKKFWLQWDGDAIKLDTYGYLMAALIKILYDANMLHGVMCMKLTTEDKMRGFRETFMVEKGGSIIQDLCPKLPFISVAYPLENDPEVKAEQKRTGYGFYGACLNNMFIGKKIIISFGGGDVLSAEEAQGYINTSIIAFRMTRRDGKEESAFANKHARNL